MIPGFLVTRETSQLGVKNIVYCRQEDALSVAEDITNYWKSKYEIDENDTDIDVDRTLYDDLLFHFDAEDCFRVAVEPILIREPGETQQLPD